jgi:hypothetical protein
LAGRNQDGQGQDGAGSGPGKDHSWEEAGSYETGGHNDAWRMSDRTSEWEEEFQDLYDAERMRDAQTLLTGLRGELDTEGHIDTMPIRLLPGDGEQVAVPSVAMPEAYREAASDALENEAIPPGYRQQVKEYFDSVSQTP